MAALVLIPAYTPTLPEDAHLTLVWPGDKPEQHVAARLAAMVKMFSQQHVAFPAKVTGVQFFGTNHDEPVLTLTLVSELALMRAAVMQFSKSEYTEFRPHVAVPSVFRSWPSRPRSARLRLPKVLYFNQVSYWPGAQGSAGHETAWLGERSWLGER